MLQILHNPRYAGAFVFGRTRTRRLPDGRSHTQILPREEWQVLLIDVHPGYLSWAEFENNQRRLKENAHAMGAERKSPPREGPALLQGVVLCGRCGERMTVRYHVRGEQLMPEYRCQRRGIERAERFCQVVPGACIDEAIGKLLIEKLEPVALEVALEVQQELRARIDEADRLRQQQVQRAQYEADLAQQRFMQVDPNNRLVADTLEAKWNDRLRAVQDAHQQYEQQRHADNTILDDGQRARVLALATDFPKLWRDPRTSQRERKRMVRLLVEDATLIKGEEITVKIRFKGGANDIITLPIPSPSWKTWQTNPKVLVEIEQLLDSCTPEQIATELNDRGFSSGKGKPFTAGIVKHLQRRYGFKSLYDRLRERGLLTKREMAHQLGICGATVDVWRRKGRLRGHRYTDKNQYLFELPDDSARNKNKKQPSSPKRGEAGGSTGESHQGGVV